MATVRIDGRDIAYQETAGRGRPMVFVHGNSSSARTWEPLLSGPLGQRFRCLAFDLPGHGQSGRLADPAGYSLPDYAAVLTGFLSALDADGATVVGWSLGGHIALEAAATTDSIAGLAIFGTPPVGSADQLGIAFLPNPAMNTGYLQDVTEDQATEYARSFLAPGSDIPLGRLVADILATDGRARTGLAAGIAQGRFADEVAVLARLRVPLAILHGGSEQLVNLDYLRALSAPTLWRGAVQVIDGAGHAPHIEAPEKLADLLSSFLTDLP